MSKKKISIIFIVDFEIHAYFSFGVRTFPLLQRLVFSSFILLQDSSLSSPVTVSQKGWFHSTPFSSLFACQIFSGDILAETFFMVTLSLFLFSSSAIFQIVSQRLFLTFQSLFPYSDHFYKLTDGHIFVTCKVFYSVLKLLNPKKSMSSVFLFRNLL
jgi:hypothetical protein